MKKQIKTKPEINVSKWGIIHICKLKELLSKLPDNTVITSMCNSLAFCDDDANYMGEVKLSNGGSLHFLRESDKAIYDK